MIKINLIVMGDIKEKYFKDAIEEYSKRISRFANLSIIELKEHVSKSSNCLDIESALKKDAEDIKKHIKGHVICLDIQGNQLSSEQLALKIEKISQTSSTISFVIGASNGIHNSIKDIANEKISFSKMTFPHQLMRVIFLEQLYRAFTINNNISYHK